MSLVIAQEQDWRGVRVTVAHADGEIVALKHLLADPADTVEVDWDSGKNQFKVTLAADRQPREEFYDYDATTGWLYRRKPLGEAVFEAIIVMHKSEVLGTLVFSTREKTQGPLPDSTGVWGGTG